MTTARVFMHGNSQAVRLPKEFRVVDDEVEILRVGQVIVLRPKRYTCDDVLRSVARFKGTFTRDQDDDQDRRGR